ncbi:MAG TPA: patatin-like phospholipase family protein, partial [Acidimicrobiales bacterium]|nr:patatin-like phospholipase family protein [Acidimicrobiales bacterium]
MLLALAEHGIAPDLIVGTSAGAINAAWIAERPGLDGARRLADIWRTIRRRDVFPVNPVLGLLGLFGRRDYLVGSSRLRALLTRNLSLERLERSPVPLRVVATEITSGVEVVIDRGSAIDAVIASAAIPAVFPPVSIEGRNLVDGGVADNTPISYAIGAGASTVYVLPTGYACSLDRPPRGALAIALQAINLLVQQRLRSDVE